MKSVFDDVPLLNRHANLMSEEGNAKVMDDDETRENPGPVPVLPEVGVGSSCRAGFGYRNRVGEVA